MAGSGRAWAGWISFAGTMLGLIGALNIFQGILALISDEKTVVVSENIVIGNLTTWGWTTLLSGVLLMAIGGGLFSGRTWARIAAVVVVMLHATSQIAWLGAYPIWALMMISLDTVVLFALTARWSAASEDLTRYRESPGDRAAEDSAGRVARDAPAYLPRVG
ncbi:MAG TPA: hypothetical protein VFH03_23690 [Actinoplanes sp.]|nr:hypothetical protein [Actinoplanes sp.]